jgi:hypothetical protein
MKRRITPSLVVSIIALVVALGGASYAAIQIPKNSVGTKQLKNRAVNTNKVKDGSLLLKDFKSGQVKPNAWEGSKDATLTPISSSFTPVVTTRTLPKGNYVLLGRVNIIGGGGTVNRIICSLGTDAAQNFTVSQTAVMPLALNGTLSPTTPQEASLSCLKTAGDPQIAQAHVIAIPVGKLTRGTSGS